MKGKIRIYKNGGAVSTDDIIDPEEVMFDGDTGLPVKDDKSEFKLAGADEDKGDEGKQDPPKKETPADPPKKDAGEEGGDGNEEEEEENEPVNHADYVLKNLGFKTDQIDLGEGVIKNVAELTQEEQLDVITGRLEEVMAFYDKQISELNETGSFANEVERTVIETLRKNEYNLADLAKIISENDPSAVARTASNEELVTMRLKRIDPNISEEELQEELESLAGTSRFERLASQERESLAKQNLGEGDFAKVIQKFREDSVAKESEDFTAKRTELNEYVKTLEKFNDIPVNDDIKNFILQDIDTDSFDKNSSFLNSIDKPETLFRLSFLDKFHEQIVESTAKQYFEMGKKEGDKIAAKFRETPEVIRTGSKFKKDSSKQQKAEKEEEEF